MDGRRRLAQPLNRTGSSPESGAAAAPRRSRAGRLRRLERRLDRHADLIARFKFHRGSGIAASLLIVLASIAYGTIKGGHVAPVVAYIKDVRDMAASAAGFRITAIAFSGQKHLNREEILARAGVTGLTSLIFLDVAATRARLLDDPRIADANIQKLYPDRLRITITEREPFALWQKSGRVSVIADDGIVLEPYVSRPFVDLPLVVGRGAEVRVKEFLGLIDRYPDIRANVRAAILVGERRWNLRLRNGIDVRLPEADVERALDRLGGLDRDKKLLSRDVAVIDLRLPDRVTVRLSDTAAQARDAVLKEKAKQKKGGNA